MENHPVLEQTCRDHLPLLELFGSRILSSAYDRALTDLFHFSPSDIAELRVAYPQLMRDLREACRLEAGDEYATQDVLRRIADRIADDPPSCKRWHGSVQGVIKNALDGGTPVISYRGISTPARRLLWQLKYGPEDINHLAEHERLRNNKTLCHVGSRCMNLNHWYKAPAAKDQAEAKRTVLANLGSRLCRNGHHVPKDDVPCSLCKRSRPERTIASRIAGHELARMVLAQGPANRAALDRRAQASSSNGSK